MKLKLLAPFLSPQFSLKSSKILQESRGYEAAWDTANELYQKTPPDLGSIPANTVSVRFEHASENKLSKTSRYRTIASHSLTRPLPVLELRVTAKGDRIAELFRQSFGAQEDRILPLATLIDEIADTLHAGKRTALLRVYDHRVSMLQLDLDLGSLADQVDPTELPKVLDGLQEGTIQFMEKLVDLYHEEILLSLFDWIRNKTNLGKTYLDGDDSNQYVAHRLEETANESSRTLWVTRALVLEAKDTLASESSRTQNFRRMLVGHWLKDVPDTDARAPSVSRRTDSESLESTRWLNHFFAEKSYPDDYPEQGWRVDGDERVRPFSSTWDAMEIAQYYYAAFDLIQTSVSYILAVSLSRTGKPSLRETQGLLDLAIRDVHMLRLEYYENKKYYSRCVASRLQDILDYWNFEDEVVGRTEQRLSACVERLDELHSRSAERSAFVTELVLLAIGVTSLFALGLALAEYGRDHTRDPALIAYEGDSFNFAQWIAAHPTDRILLVILAISLVFFFIYLFFRGWKPKS